MWNKKSNTHKNTSSKTVQADSTSVLLGFFSLHVLCTAEAWRITTLCRVSLEWQGMCVCVFRQACSLAVNGP